MSATRDTLLLWLDQLGFRREVPFRGLSGKRRFRCDAGMPERRVCVDYHGWGTGAAHMYRAKQAGDHEKISELALCGWSYIVCNAISVENGKCMEYVELAMRGSEA